MIWIHLQPFQMCILIEMIFEVPWFCILVTRLWNWYLHIDLSLEVFPICTRWIFLFSFDVSNWCLLLQLIGLLNLLPSWMLLYLVTMSTTSLPKSSLICFCNYYECIYGHALPILWKIQIQLMIPSHWSNQLQVSKWSLIQFNFLPNQSSSHWKKSKVTEIDKA